MAEATGEKIKVVLRWIQIRDDREPFWHEKGEFRFQSRVSSENRDGIVQETRFPEEGTWGIRDHPAWNRRSLNKVLFEGEVDDHLVIELFGEEVDPIGKNDPLDEYRREFRGPAESFVGRYGYGQDTPEDDPSVDLEKMDYWGVCYDIELA